MNRVVITGMGWVSPIGHNEEETISNMKNSYCGIKKIDRLKDEDIDIHVAGQIDDLDFRDYMTRQELSRMDRVDTLALVAATKAVDNSGIDFEELDPTRVGIYMSSGIGGIITIQKQSERANRRGYSRLSPYFIPSSLINLITTPIAMKYGIHGSVLSPVTACSGSNTAIGEAFRNIKDGYSDVILAGGSEAAITELGIGGFASMRALSTSKDPQKSSIPFDKDRDGFVMGEGAAVLVLESLESAKKRGANILAEVIGYGATCDGEHITRPNEDGIYAAKAMELAIKEGGLQPEDIDYINAHGTSTPLNDLFETKAIKRVFGEKSPVVTSTKSMTGHLLGAAGAIEGVLSILGMNNGFVPPNINLKSQDPKIDLDIKTTAEEMDYDYVLSNALGFGGHNASVVYRRWKDEA